MKTISSHVEDYIKRRPFLAKYLNRRVINYRALARTIRTDIQERTGEPVSLEAIAISLQRLAGQLKVDMQPIGVLKGTVLISNLNMLLYKKGNVPDEIMNMAGSSNGFWQCVQDEDKTAIIINDALYEQLPAEAKNLVIERIAHLTALEIQLVEGTHSTKPGSLVYATSVLAENAIPILQVLSTTNTQFIIIEEKYIDEAVRLLRSSLAR